MMSRQSSVLRLFTIVSVLLVAGLVPFVADSASNEWTTSDPFRVLDTRPGQPTADGSHAGGGQLRAGTTLELQLTGRVGMPTDVDTVLLNLTAINAASAGYVTVYPCDISRPGTASLNVVAGSARGNLVAARVDSRGKTCIYSSTSTDLVADVQSYTRQVIERIDPARVLDSRPGLGTVDGLYNTSDKLSAGSTVELQLAGRAGIPANASTVLLNVTTTESNGNGYVTVHSCDPERPNSSNLNYTMGSSQAGFAVAQLDDNGSVCLYLHAETHLVIDAQGYTVDALKPIGPRRLLDTRPGQATFDGVSAGIGRQPARSTIELRVSGRAGIPADANVALLNVTAANPSSNGFLTVHGCDDARPNASNVNYTGGVTQGNVVVARIDPSGRTCIYTHATTDIVVDVQGYIVGAAIVKPPQQVYARDLAERAGFVHPGVLVDRNQLEEMRINVAAGREPWATALQRTYQTGASAPTSLRPTSYKYSSLSYQPAPVRVIQAASSGNLSYLTSHGMENIGDQEHLDDARAAYTHALLWYATGNHAHADKAIQIMNAWSSTLTEIKFDQPRRTDNNVQVFNNGKLQAGWGGALFARAGEIIRYSNAGWSTADIARFEAMLHDVHLPLTIDGWTGGANWLMTLAEATISIGVFTNDRAAFDAGVAMWRAKAPTTIYHPSDGPLPLPANSKMDTTSEINAYWRHPNYYPSGLQGETLRDLSHMSMGLGALANAAETAYLQGVDLYGEQADRIIAGLELNAGYVNAYLDEVNRLGGNQPSSTWTPPNWPGNAGTFSLGGTAYRSGWAIAHHHYTQRTGHVLHQTTRLLQRLGPTASQPALHMSWEPLTHSN